VRPSVGPHAACPRCGAPADENQEYCVECGLRLPHARPAFARRAGRPWNASSSLVAVVVFLVLAGLGAAAAVLITRDDSGETFVATSPLAHPVTRETLPTPPTTTPAPTIPEPQTTAPAEPAQPEQPIEWPDRDGYTIVLQSIPTSSSRRGALETARRAIRAGLHDVGVLASSNYPSLQPGYYVVFAGVYDSSGEASGALGEAEVVGFSAYVRPVSR